MIDAETIVDVAWMTILFGFLLLFVVMLAWHRDMKRIRFDDDSDDDETPRHN